MPAKHNFLPYDKKALKPLLHLLANQNQNAYSLIWDLQFPRNEGFNPILLFDTQFHLIGIRHRPIIFPLSLNQNFTEETRTSNSQIVSLILNSRAMLLTVRSDFTPPKKELLSGLSFGHKACLPKPKHQVQQYAVLSRSNLCRVFSHFLAYF